MSNRLFPALPGITWNQVRTVLAPPVHVRTTPSRREFRSRSSTLPLYQYTLTYEFLRGRAINDHLQQLVGLFNLCGGSFDSLLLTDIADQAVTAAPFGAGDGSTTAFQLVRPFGGFAEAVFDLNGAPLIYVAGVLQVSGYTVSASAVVTFSAAPALGAALTWSGAFYRRARFLRDQLETNAFMQDLYEAKKVELLSLKT